MEAELEALLTPISATEPCGVDLEDTQLLASFDAYRLFGQSTPIDEPPSDTAKGKPASIDWREVRGRALEAMKQSKDLRLLAHLAAAELRLSGRSGYFDTLGIAAAWVCDHWQQVYPRVDDDAIMRMNALNCFADRMAVADGFRKVPILEHRQLGRLTLRDVELAEGRRPAADNESVADTAARIAAVFAATDLAVLQALEADYAAAIAALRAIDAAMQEAGGLAVSPDFKPLIDDDDKHPGVLHKTITLLREQLRARAPAVELAGAGETSGDAAAAGGSAVAHDVPAGALAVGPRGPVRNRQDALAALDSVASFFSQYEPSSPVPLLIERAKRLVGKNFLEVLSDLAPEGVPTARAAGGLKDE